MNKTIFTVIFTVIAIVAAFFLGRSMLPPDDSNASNLSEGQREVLYWAAPMDPNFRRDAPGKSPMGMDLIAVYADQAASLPGTVSIDPTVVNNLGVRTEKAAFGELSRRIETVGYVGYDEETLQHVHTRVDGWIEKLATKSSGDAVQKGQLLFELYSPTLVNSVII